MAMTADSGQHGQRHPADPAAALAERLFQDVTGALELFTVYLGDRLGLYRAMAGRGPMTAAGLAAATGLQERWLLEWLRGQAAAGLIGTEDGEAFEMELRVHSSF